MSKAEPLGKISDWFYRVEYQQRGSPHIPMLIWLEDAPQFRIESDEKVTAFIDKIITCRFANSTVSHKQLLDDHNCSQSHHAMT